MGSRRAARDLLGALAFTAATFVAAVLGSGWVRGCVQDWLREPSGAALAQRWANLASLGTFFAILSVGAIGLATWGGGRRELRSRLGLRRAGMDGVTVACCVVGTPFLVYLGGLLAGFLGEPSARLRAFERVLTQEAGGDRLTALLILAIALGPAIGEELLLRGALLHRARASLSTTWSVGLVTLVFAAAHADVQQGVGVLPLGLWLTILTVASGSLWPAIMCHFVGNFVSCVLIAWFDAGVGRMPIFVHALAWGVAFPALVSAGFIHWKKQRDEVGI